MVLSVMAMLGAAVTLPVEKAAEVVDFRARTCPAKIASVSEVSVTPQVSGEILEVCFANGQTVAKGDALYRLDPVKYIAAEKNAEAKVAEAKARLEYAGMQAVRYGELVKTRAVPRDDYDRVCSQREVYTALLAAAEADLAAARDDVKHCTIAAPIAGRVGSTRLTEGNFVTRGGAELVKLVQTDPVRAVFELSSCDYESDFGGDPARLSSEGAVELRRLAGGAVVATGRVEYVENVANPQTDSVRIFALFENASGRLLAGQTAMATLRNAGGAKCAAVPPNAVALDSRGTYVWALDAGGAARMRRVVRGRMQGGMQLIASGLAPGERVVADGVHRVAEGDIVTPEK